MKKESLLKKILAFALSCMVAFGIVVFGNATIKVDAAGNYGSWRYLSVDSVSANLNTGDKIVLLDVDGYGVSGASHKNAKISGFKTDWLEFTVYVDGDRFAAKDEATGKYLGLTSGNDFEIEGSLDYCCGVTGGGKFYVEDEDGVSHFLCETGQNTKYYTSTNGKKSFYIYKIAHFNQLTESRDKILIDNGVNKTEALDIAYNEVGYPWGETVKVIYAENADGTYQVLKFNGYFWKFQDETATYQDCINDMKYNGVTYYFIGRISVKTVSLDKEVLYLIPGNEDACDYTFETTITPEDATITTFDWVSSDKSVASVDKDGKVVANKVGTTTISGTCDSVTDTCEVKVVNYTLLTDMTSDTVIDDGLLEAPAKELVNKICKSFTNDGNNVSKEKYVFAGNDDSFTVLEGRYSTSWELVSTISSLAELRDLVHEDDSYKIYVLGTIAEEGKATSVDLDCNALNLKLGESYDLTETVYPYYTKDPSVTWESDNESVVTVDENGNVSTVGTGTATVTVTTVDGGFTAECFVTCYEVATLTKFTKEVTLVRNFSAAETGKIAKKLLTLGDSKYYVVYSYDKATDVYKSLYVEYKDSQLSSNLKEGKLADIVYDCTYGYNVYALATATDAYSEITYEFNAVNKYSVSIDFSDGGLLASYCDAIYQTEVDTFELLSDSLPKVLEVASYDSLFENYILYGAHSSVKGGNITVLLKKMDGILDLIAAGHEIYALGTVNHEYPITNLTPFADKEKNSGYIEIDSKVANDALVNIVSYPDEGKCVSSVIIYKTGDPSTIVATNVSSFKMPEFEVSVKVTFAPIDLSGFDDFKNEQMYEIECEKKPGDTQDDTDLLDGYKNQIKDYQYDGTIPYDENKQKISDIVDEAERAISQLRKEEAFASYKEDKIKELNEKLVEGDSKEVKDLIAKVEDDIKKLDYDKSKTLEENKDEVDKLVKAVDNVLNLQRYQEEFAKYQNEKKDEVVSLIQANDSKATKKIINDDANDIAGLVYNKDLSLEDNKARIDAIADLTAGKAQLQRDKEEYQNYQQIQYNSLPFLLKETDGQDAIDVVEKGQKEINDLAYDENKSVDENKAALDEIALRVANDLKALRVDDVFEEYVKQKQNELGELVNEDDSSAAKLIVLLAKTKIGTIKYDPELSLDDNKAKVDEAIAYVPDALALQRDKDAFAAYAYKKANELDDILEATDSVKTKVIVSNAKLGINKLTYDETKTLEENKNVVDEKFNLVEPKVTLQRNKEAFDKYKVSAKEDINNLLKEDDSYITKQIANDEKANVTSTYYDEELDLEANKARVDKIVNAVEPKLELQRNKEAFDTYKTQNKLYLNSLVKNDDIAVAKKVISDAVAEINDLSYDEAIDLAANKAIVDEIVKKAVVDLDDNRLDDDFDDYADDKEDDLDKLLNEDDSEESKKIIDDAKEEIKNKKYDENKSLEENKKDLDEIINKAKEALEKQRNQEAFDNYVEEKNKELGELVEPNDSLASKKIVSDGKSALNRIKYDETKSLEENKKIIDDKANEVAPKVALQRNKEAFEKYKNNGVNTIDEAILDSDSSAVRQIAIEGKNEVRTLEFDESKTLDENKKVVDKVVNDTQTKMTTQRINDNQEKTFDQYLEELKKNLSNLLENTDASEVRKIVDDAKNEVNKYVYDPDTELNDVKDKGNELIEKTKKAIEELRKALDYQDKKDEIIKELQNLKEDDDSDESTKIIEEAINNVNDLKYDDTKTLDENKEALEELLTKAEDDVQIQRNLEAYEQFKKEQQAKIDELAKENNNEKVAKAIEEASANINAQGFDKNKSYSDNVAAINKIVENIKKEQENANQNTETKGLSDVGTIAIVATAGALLIFLVCLFTIKSDKKESKEDKEKQAAEIKAKEEARKKAKEEKASKKAAEKAKKAEEKAKKAEEAKKAKKEEK